MIETEMTDREQFDSRIVPVMDRVRQELQSRQAAEVRRYMRSPAYILSGISGPDGGMASQAIAIDSLKVTGEWNSKTVEDYVEMVKAELIKEGISVTPEQEEMMIDKMARDNMPKSSIEYILRKAAGNTIFGLPEEARKTPLQREVEERAEALYGPTKAEKGIGWGLGAAADFATLGGLSGGIAGGLKFVGADLAINAVVDSVDSKRKEVPSVVLPGHEEEWLEMNQANEGPIVEETEPKVSQIEAKGEEVSPHVNKQEGPAGVSQNPTEEPKKEENVSIKIKQTPAEQQTKSNTGGWQGILSGLGLNGISDIGRNAGYILAMLPDMLLGMFTGKTQSLGLKNNLVPIASIMAGLFVKNPLLKMTLIGLGGANLLNRAGHEQLAKQEGIQQPQSQVCYRRYEEQDIDPRIKDAEIKGKTLIATIDGIPVTVTLPDKVMDAYSTGALPLGTLANAVLQRCDQMQQVSTARDRFEEESRTEGRALTQK